MSTLTNLPSWDLSGLFKGIDDPAIETAIIDSKAAAKAFSEQFKGKLVQSDVAASLVASACDDYERILTTLFKLSSYSQLVFAADSLNQKHGAFVQRVSSEFENINQDLLFFDLELMDLPEESLQRLMDDPALAHRRYYLSLIKRGRPHHLTEAEEKILGLKSLTGSQAFGRLFNQEHSAIEFKVEGQEKSLSQSEALHLLYNPDRELRKAASAGISKGLSDNLARMTFIYNMLVMDKGADDRLRKYPSSEEARHLSNQTNQASVDALNNALGERIALVEEYYSFKREVLGLDKLTQYDRYAPIPGGSQTFSYEESKQIVLDSFAKFDQRFADTAKQFFDGNWIDAAQRPGKQSGAFCSFVTPDHHPYVFLNFQGGTRDVMTMAHELGHGIHACLARKQHLLDAHAPLTICETASIFGEMIVFDALKERFKNNPSQLLSLYMQKIEEIFASTFRQIFMYRFEKEVHSKVKAQGELSSEELSSIWMSTQKQMFGASVELQDEYASWWSYISHFFEMPFYVYAYAFGELLTLSVYQKYKAEGQTMVEAYFNFLAAGGSRKPEELVASLGLDMADASFWHQGLDLIGDLIKEAKQLHAQAQKA